MKAIISRTNNGAWMRIIDKQEEEFNRTRDTSYQFEFDAYKHDGDDMKGLVEMLYEMLDAMGWCGGSRDKEVVGIRIAHGHKFEHSEDDPADKCAICKENSDAI